MVSWSEFERSAPELASVVRTRFAATQLVMMGTLRKNGWPRVTPIEYTIFESDLVIGGMWRSKKMLDLLRDPRCALHSTTTNKDGTEGDAKLYGRAVPLAEERLEPYWQHIYDEIGFRPDGPAHVFSIDIVSAGYTVFGDGTMRMLRWPAGPGTWETRASP